MKFIFKLFIIGSLLGTFSNGNPVESSRQKLRGVTVRSPPFVTPVEGQDSKFEGFMVDLLDALSKKADFEYSLYLSPDGRYGGAGLNGIVNGMIGEVNNSKADFAAADLTVTEARERYVDFTEPFMVNQLSALIRREDAIGMKSMEDLVSVDNDSSTVEPGAATTPAKQLVFGALQNGATNYLLSKTEDPVGRKLYELMQKSPEESFVKSSTEGVDRVIQQGGYVFIMESGTAEHIAAENCNITVLFDKRSLYPRKYSLALPKGSPLLDKFNMAIKQLKAEGVIEELKKKYWTNNCETMKDAAPEMTTMMTPSQ